MDWNDLRYFLAVARSGSLAGAARELGVEHTTVSRRIGALESTLGVKLFGRGPAGLTLTPAGQDILPSVERIAEQIEAVEKRIAGGDAKVAGTVRLTIPESANAYFAQQFAALRQRHPELVIEVLSANRVLDLRRGEADLAVRFANTPDQALIVRRAGTAGWSLYASPAYVAKHGKRLGPDDLRAHCFIGFDASLAEAEGGLWLRANVPPERVVLRGNSIGAVANAAAAGIGVAPLPCFVAAAEPGIERIAPQLIGVREIHLVAHPDLVRVARVRATMDFLLEVFARDATKWSGAVDAPAPASSA